MTRAAFLAALLCAVALPAGAAAAENNVLAIETIPTNPGNMPTITFRRGFTVAEELSALDRLERAHKICSQNVSCLRGIDTGGICIERHEPPWEKPCSEIMKKKRERDLDFVRGVAEGQK